MFGVSFWIEHISSRSNVFNHAFQYIQVLKQKRELLKKNCGRVDTLEYSTQTIRAAVISGRLNILEELSEPFQQMHQRLWVMKKYPGYSRIGAGPVGFNV